MRLFFRAEHRFVARRANLGKSFGLQHTNWSRDQSASAIRRARLYLEHHKSTVIEFLVRTLNAEPLPTIRIIFLSRILPCVNSSTIEEHDDA